MLPISESKFWRSQLLVCVCKFEFAIRCWIEADWACRNKDTLFYAKHFEGTVRQKWRGQIFLTYPIYPWLMILSGIRFIPHFLGGHPNLKFNVRSAPTLNYHLCVRTVLSKVHGRPQGERRKNWYIVDYLVRGTKWKKRTSGMPLTCFGLNYCAFCSFERTLELRHKMNSIANKIAIGIRNGKIKR